MWEFAKFSDSSNRSTGTIRGSIDGIIMAQMSMESNDRESARSGPHQQAATMLSKIAQGIRDQTGAIMLARNGAVAVDPVTGRKIPRSGNPSFGYSHEEERLALPDGLAVFAIVHYIHVAEKRARRRWTMTSQWLKSMERCISLIKTLRIKETTWFSVTAGQRNIITTSVSNRGRKENNPVRAFVAIAFFIAISSCDGAVLFCEASRNYNESGLLGRVLRKEIETRMFTHSTWRQRLFYSSYDPNVNETLEIYSKSDGSHWLCHRAATPSLSRIIGRRLWLGEQFDLAKELDSVHIKSCEIAIPVSISEPIDSLWYTMLPGCTKEPVTRELFIHVPVVTAFTRKNGSVEAGSMSLAAYNTDSYQEFVEIVVELRKMCKEEKISADTLRKLPRKIALREAKLR